METKIESLFIAYLEKSISAEEEEFLFRWIKSNPESIEELHEIRYLWNATGVIGNSSEELLGKEWVLFLERVNKTIPEQPVQTHSLRYWLPRVAAVFMLGAVISFLVSYSIFKPPSNETVYQEIVAPAGAKSKITLPDGSTVWLNAGSSIKYSNRFGEKQREVALSGEAYFDVVTNLSKVFLVKTSELNIKAYGTTFNVKCYPEEGTVETTLLSGSIGVKRVGLAGNKTDEVVLQPNQRVVYYKSSQKEKETIPDKVIDQSSPMSKKRVKNQSTYMISKGIDAQTFAAWKDGVLVINSESLEDLAVKLERKYDVKITFDNEKLQQIKFTGILENETVEQVIEAIGIAANIDFQVKDRDIRFKEK